MNNNHQALWANCLRLIQANVTEQQYKTWFAPIVFESFDEANRSVLVRFQADMYSSSWSSTTLDY